MKFKIFPGIFKSFPKLHIGLVAVKGIDNTGSQEKIFHLLDEVEKLIKLNFVPEKLSQHALISPWRTAYSEFGSKPSHFPSSVEALMRRILKGEKLRINKAVDVYNYLSLKHMIPMGAYDLDKIYDQVSLCHANGSEIFIPLNNHVVEHPDKDEIVYKDGRQVLCRKWNWRDSNRTKVSSETKNLLMFVEGLPPVTREQVEDATKELIALITTFCGGEAKYWILDLAESEVDF